MKLEVVLVSGVVFGVLTGLIWDNKGGKFGIGFLFGFLGGLIGLIIAAVLKPKAATRPNTRECPFCKTQIARDATFCPHCQKESEPWMLHDGKWWVKRDSGHYYLDEKSKQWVHVPAPEKEDATSAAPPG